MGLMYIFPVELNEDERVTLNENELTLKTYGLPMIFWGYLAAILTVIGAMSLAIKSVLIKMLNYDDSALVFLAYLVIVTLILGPVILIGAYFYEKFITKKDNKITITHRVFFMPILKKVITLDSKDSLIVEHFMESPNMAKMKNKEELRGFENKGYFELKALSNGKRIYLDRHSRKIDLIKMKDLLIQY